MTNKEDQRRRWREIAEQLGIEPGSEPEMEPEPEVEAAEPEFEPEPIPEPVMEMEEEEEDRPFELPPDDDLDEIAATSSVEESFEEESVEPFRDSSTGEDEPLDREMPAGEGGGASDERGTRRERGGRRRGRRRRGGRSGKDKPVAADATPAEPGAEPALPAAAEAPNERRPSSRRRGERRDDRRDEPRGRSRRGRAPEPIEEEQPQDSFESEAPVEALDSFDDSMDLESPDIAAQDDGEEYADLYSNWTVPSWTELIASLYRPER